MLAIKATYINLVGTAKVSLLLDSHLSVVFHIDHPQIYLKLFLQTRSIMRSAVLSVMLVALMMLVDSSTGAPEPKKGPKCICTQELSPVCASDLRTYLNPCMFRCRQKVIPGLYILYFGRCKHDG